MPYAFIDVLHRVAPHLISLAETTFDFDDVKKRCRGWGWILTEDAPNVGVARFDVGECRAGLRLRQDRRVKRTSLSLVSPVLLAG